MKKQISRLISSRGGRNPGNGATRVSPGVYRQGPPPQNAIPRPAAGAMPQMPQQPQAVQRPTFSQPQMQAPMVPWQQQQAPMPQGNQAGSGQAAPLDPAQADAYAKQSGMPQGYGQDIMAGQNGQAPISQMQGYWRKG